MCDELPVLERETLSRVWKYAGEGRGSYIVDGNGFTIAGPMIASVAALLVSQHNQVVNRMIDEHLTAIHNLK